jgi:hypothetical protein
MPLRFQVSLRMRVRGMVMCATCKSNEQQLEQALNDVFDGRADAFEWLLENKMLQKLTDEDGRNTPGMLFSLLFSVYRFSSFDSAGVPVGRRETEKARRWSVKELKRLLTEPQS